MVIISWNISWQSKRERILEKLKELIDSSSMIVCLQEVLPPVKDYICQGLGEEFNYTYSLSYRYPGEFDTRSRELGVLIITSSDIELTRRGVLNRTPCPDRTAFIEFSYCGASYTLVSLHSVTGVDYKKGKSVQFYSFAEAIKDLHPDIVTFDSNEPKVDHYNVSQMEFFNNRDKGAGARCFFTSLVDVGLSDAYALFYDKEAYVPGRPLATSHIVSKKEGARRYDFVFVNDKRLALRGCEYHYDEAVAATSDHAYVVAWSDMELVAAREKPFNPKSGADKEYTEKDLIPFCRHYDPLKPSHAQTQFGFYEYKWIEAMIGERQYIIEMVTVYINYNLETFNVSDGVPISLKALLFNRYTHWESYFTAEGFKEWYISSYLNEKD